MPYHYNLLVCICCYQTPLWWGILSLHTGHPNPDVCLHLLLLFWQPPVDKNESHLTTSVNRIQYSNNPYVENKCVLTRCGPKKLILTIPVAQKSKWFNNSCEQKSHTKIGVLITPMWTKMSVPTTCCGQLKTVCNNPLCTKIKVF